MALAYCQGTQQPLSAAARQRWSAREVERAAPCHAPSPFGKEGAPCAGAGGSAAQSLSGNGSGPRSWHSYGHTTRPRSVEGGRPMDPRGVASRRVGYYSSQPSTESPPLVPQRQADHVREDPVRQLENFAAIEEGKNP